ncbi:MAG: GYD domain-containing protein [Dehalococcoidia bacterium]|nr:GYD domain-containing protein [Dehalococcoidia bacterium]
MPSYLSLLNWTDQGVRDIKNSYQRVDAAKQAARDAGGRIIFFYMTMGQYDLAVLTELPNDEVAAKYLLALGGLGNVRSTTLKAFTEAEFRTIIGAPPLPPRTDMR